VQVHAREPERGRDHDSARLAIRTKRLAVDEHGGIVASRTPRVEHSPQRAIVDAEELRHRRQIRREGHDRADVQIAIRPSIAEAREGDTPVEVGSI
jgi:hypothetical protein